MVVNPLNLADLMESDPYLKEQGYSCFLQMDGKVMFCRNDEWGNRITICRFNRGDSMYKVIWSDLPRQRARFKWFEAYAERHNAQVDQWLNERSRHWAKEAVEAFKRYVGHKEHVSVGMSE